MIRMGGITRFLIDALTCVCDPTLMVDSVEERWVSTSVMAWAWRSGVEGARYLHLHLRNSSVDKHPKQRCEYPSLQIRVDRIPWLHARILAVIPVMVVVVVVVVVVATDHGFNLVIRTRAREANFRCYNLRSGDTLSPNNPHCSRFSFPWVCMRVCFSFEWAFICAIYRCHGARPTWNERERIIPPRLDQEKRTMYIFIYTCMC